MKGVHNLKENAKKHREETISKSTNLLEEQNTDDCVNIWKTR